MQRVSTIIKNLNLFKDNSRSINEWITGNNLSIYVRKAHHCNENNTLIETFDIATISCKKPSKGYFTSFLNKVEKTSSFPIYIENVSKTRLQSFFQKRGYKRIPQANRGMDDLMCFIYYPPRQLSLW